MRFTSGKAMAMCGKTLLSAAVLNFVYSSPVTWAADPPTLKDAFADAFKIGAAIGTSQVRGDEPAALELAAGHFNSITPENLLKWAEVHPQADRYNFQPVDKYVAFGQQHGMFIVGHTLVWHNQTPAWVFEGSDGQPLTRDALVSRMREHIHTVVGRYRGRIHAWDVVNEALDDDGSLRESPWKRIIGDDYIELAFRFTHEADPQAELYYNDYNEWHAAKRPAIGRLVRSLQQKGVRCDGIGLQGHWGMDYPSIEEVEAMLADYEKLGVKLMVTELDVNILPRPTGETGADVRLSAQASAALDPYANGLPEEVNQALADRYAALFGLFMAHRDSIDRVTFWGIHDGQSWLNNWPVRGRTAYPLLFDRSLCPKLAFTRVIETAKNK